MQRHFLTNGPSEHASIVLNKTWATPHAHATSPVVASTSELAETTSQVLFTYVVDPLLVPATATHLALRIKVKAYIPNGPDSGTMNYGLVYANIPGNNHFIHCEEWGRGADSQGESRRVTYTTVDIPIVDGEVSIQVGTEISGRATVDFVAYLEGYWAP